MTVLPRSQQSLEQNLSLKGLRILLVDSDPDSRLVSILSLELLGARVIAVASALEAMGYLEQEQFHILISDLVLPGEDGCSLMRRVRTLLGSKNAHILAIALTACRLDQLCEQAIEAGFDIYHEKPLLPSDLALLINALLNCHRRSDEQTSPVQICSVCLG